MGSSCLPLEELQDQGTTLGEPCQPKSPGRLLRCPLTLLDLSDPVCHLQPCSFLFEMVLKQESL